MKKLTLLIVLLIVTGLGIAYHHAASGNATAARAAVPPPRIELDRPPAPPADLAHATLERGNKLLAQGNLAHAAAHFRACLALEGAAGDVATLRAARAGLERIAEASTPRQVRKGTVAKLAEKVLAPEPPVPVKPQPPRAAVAVGPDGVVYETVP